jgi:sugar phosphate isomerase/epimerase
MALLRTDNQLRLGGVCFAGKDPRSLVDYHVKQGFSAAYDPEIEDRVQMEEVVAAFREADIVIAETPAFGINLADPNPKLWEQNIARLCRRLERAESVGALCCVAHGGTPNTPQMWMHNPANFGQATIDRTVVAVQRILDTVKPQTTKLVLETESRILPDSPDLYLEIIQAVDRPGFAVHLDPVNITSSPRRFYFSGDFIRDCFQKLGPYVVSCHAKDIKMVNGAQVHFEETFAGDGGLDYRAFLSEVVALDRDVPLMFEHFPERQQQWARDYVREQAAALSIPVRHARFAS